MKICIVSPHLDDALLSCGILMQRRLAARDEVFVVNIFNAGTNGENRRKEDERAQKKMGGQTFFLDELDAPDRNAKYKPLKNLFFSPLEPADDPLIVRVARRLGEFFAKHGIDTAYFPLAAGTHIDHRVAHEAGRRTKAPAVRFYEDRPYILWPGVLQGRLNQIGCKAMVQAPGVPPVTGRTMTAAADAYHYLAHFVPEGSYRQETLPLYIAALDPPASFTLEAAPEVLEATEEEVKKLYDCLKLYDSQMSYIYKDDANFIGDSRAYERATWGRETYAERTWALTLLR